MKSRNKKNVPVIFLIILVCTFNFYSLLSDLYAKNDNLLGTSSSAAVVKIKKQNSGEAYYEIAAVAFVVVVSTAIAYATFATLAATVSSSSSCAIIGPNMSNLYSNSELQNVNKTELLLKQLH